MSEVTNTSTLREALERIAAHQPPQGSKAAWRSFVIAREALEEETPPDVLTLRWCEDCGQRDMVEESRGLGGPHARRGLPWETCRGRVHTLEYVREGR